MTVTAIVDTNVILDIYLVNDLFKAYAKADGDSEEGLFRRARARESHLLAWYLHEKGALTLSLPNESLKLMIKMADPKALHTVESQHAQLSIYFVKDYILDRWRGCYVRGSDDNIKGNACDDRLLDLAEQHRAPLITNEGYSVNGISNDEPGKLRAKAHKRGIKVYTPRQFWDGHMGERATKKFMARFDAMAPKYLQGQGRRPAAVRAVDLRRGILSHIFLGETDDGRDCLCAWVIRLEPRAADRV